MPDQKLAYSATSPPYLWSNDDEDGLVMHNLKPNILVVRPSIMSVWLLKLLPSTDRRCWDAAGNYKQEQMRRQHPTSLSQLLRVGCKRKREISFEYSKHDNKSVMHMHAVN